MNRPDWRSFVRPPADRFQHDATALIERQNTRIGRRGVPVKGVGVRLQQDDALRLPGLAREQQGERRPRRACAQDGDIEVLI